MKNLNLGFFLSAALLLAATLPGSAQLVLNFDSDTAGSAPSTPAGVGFVTGGEGTALVSSAASVSTPYTTGDYTEGVVYGPSVIADLADPSVVSFSLLLPDTTNDFYFSVGDANDSAVDQIGFIAGEFYGYDGTTPGATPLGTYSAGVFYTVQLTLDPSTNTFTTDLVEPDGTVIDSSSTLASLSTAALGSLIFESVPTGTVATATVEDYVDNVSIAPEPSSYALALMGGGLLLAFRLIMRKRVSPASGNL
jgi:hypothetical protein